MNLLKQKQDAQEQLKEMENSVKNLKNEPVTEDKTRKELNEKKKKLFEKLEEQRKKFYMIKSELNSTKERVLDKTNLLQTYENESDFLLKQIEITSLEISDIKTNQLKLDKLNEHLFQLKVSPPTNSPREELSLIKIF